jgi:hypothetical protein
MIYYAIIFYYPAEFVASDYRHFAVQLNSFYVDNLPCPFSINGTVDNLKCFSLNCQLTVVANCRQAAMHIIVFPTVQQETTQHRVFPIAWLQMLPQQTSSRLRFSTRCIDKRRRNGRHTIDS